MARELFIVARDRLDLFRYLTQIFSDAESVQVIADRRLGERRALAGPPPAVERRRAQRRTRAGLDGELRATGYVFIGPR